MSPEPDCFLPLDVVFSSRRLLLLLTSSSLPVANRACVPVFGPPCWPVASNSVEAVLLAGSKVLSQVDGVPLIN
jgi:hypothetical protein